MSVADRKVIIVGITGLAGCGKDLVAQYLCDTYHFDKAGFADPLKYVCAELFLEPPNKFFSSEGKTEVMPYWGITRRAALQFVGTELVRDHLWKLCQDLQTLTETFHDLEKENHWVRCMEKRILDSGMSRVAINDLRFQNEADWVYENNGWILHITGRQTEVLGGIKDHSSEAGFTFNGDRTWRIDNSGTVESLYHQLDEFIEKTKLIIRIS